MASVDISEPIRVTSRWLGIDEAELNGVPERVIRAIMTRLHTPDEAADQRIEMLERLHVSVTRLETLARTDALTSIANRRAVEERLDHELARAKRHERELSLILLDVNGLKHVNDTLGHQAGDALLREVAHRIETVVRATDLAGRWGGDEFAVVCPETDGAAVRSLADKLRRVVAARQIKAAGTCIDASISVGWAGDGRHYVDASCLIANADASLYAAKRIGRR